ncbi:MAG: transposase [Bdellovibrionales bacterium]|nr:transposase [Bdellovibrionales bacterium]
MPRYPRSWTLEKDLAFHKVWRGHNREWNLGSVDEKQKYLNLLGEEQQRICEKSNPLHAICIMSNHAHELYTLEHLTTFSNFMRQHHGRYGRFFNNKHKRQGKVAQDRPKTSAIENDYHEMMVTFYIHANPIRAKICKNASNYSWSTHMLYAFGKRAKWMKDIRIQFPNWYLNLGNTWKERQIKYRKAFDSYLKEYGLQKKHFCVFGIGSYQWLFDRKKNFRSIWKDRQTIKITSPPE